jgi:hypothetical protein
VDLYSQSWCPACGRLPDPPTRSTGSHFDWYVDRKTCAGRDSSHCCLRVAIDGLYPILQAMTAQTAGMASHKLENTGLSWSMIQLWSRVVRSSLLQHGHSWSLKSGKRLTNWVSIDLVTGDQPMLVLCVTEQAS